jgi:hypothetical protein
MKRFVWGMVAGVAAAFGGLTAVFGVVALLWPEHLPAPAISRLVHYDEKLRFIRQRPGLDPRILAVGSSLAWRQLDGAQIESSLRHSGAFFNGATARLQIHQTRALTAFYLAYFRNVQTVLLLTGLPDFEDCTEEQADIVNAADAGRYAFGGWPSAYFYFRYFSPQRYVAMFNSLEKRRQPFTGDMFLDRYGSGPAQLPPGVKLGLRYGEIGTDQTCIGALLELSHMLTSRHIRLAIVFTPVNPLYRTAIPASDAQHDQLVEAVRAGTAGDQTTTIDLQDDARFVASEFYDAFHFEWPGVQRFTAALLPDLEKLASGERPADVQRPSVQ